jgi:hypothetical protein
VGAIGMEDVALFFRQRALACFHRRRRWPFFSAAWRHEVADARRFIRASRDNLQGYSADQRRKFAAQITRARYALGPPGPHDINRPAPSDDS